MFKAACDRTLFRIKGFKVARIVWAPVRVLRRSRGSTRLLGWRVKQSMQTMMYTTTVARTREGCSYMNGSPHNTLVPGRADLAEKHNVFIAGDVLKPGQTNTKSALAQFFEGASYNHLGNNDGRHPTGPKTVPERNLKANVGRRCRLRRDPVPSGIDTTALSSNISSMSAIRSATWTNTSFRSSWVVSSAS